MTCARSAGGCAPPRRRPRTCCWSTSPGTAWSAAAATTSTSP
ncbi:hypothetical protein ACFQ0M_34785 [Kitasatospora aburaviensis]